MSDQLGDVQHPFRRTVVKAIPFAKAAERVPDLDVATFWRIVHQTPEFLRAAYVTIAYLGLRVGEYLRLQDTDLVTSGSERIGCVRERLSKQATCGCTTCVTSLPNCW